jgi:glycine cleavage system transcriptional repressor
MKQALVTIIGRDGPGIVHLVSRVLADQGCHILGLSQTTLLGQFAGLFSTKVPDSRSLGDLSDVLSASLAGTSLSYWIAPPDDDGQAPAVKSEPYVLTITGPDRPEIIVEVTKTVASFDANIDNLRAVTISGGEPEDQPAGPPPLVLVLEVTVPESVQGNAFRQALAMTAEELGIEISLQHRDIFEAVHRL